MIISKGIILYNHLLEGLVKWYDLWDVNEKSEMMLNWFTLKWELKFNLFLHSVVVAEESEELKEGVEICDGAFIMYKTIEKCLERWGQPQKCKNKNFLSFWDCTHQQPSPLYWQDFALS